uniref:HMG box domain-containing protein n=1 Tax=Mus spicilegus TaxID=10103 RepID=A0A8C6MPX6_MUSSI
MLILPIHEHGRPFHFLSSSLISFFRDLKFLSHRSFTSLVRVRPRYFILFVTIEKGDLLAFIVSDKKFGIQSGESEEAASGSRSHSHCSTLSSIETALGQAQPDGHWATLCLAEENQLNMGKGDPKKPRGKMSSCAFFVQTCREEHKKKHPDASVNFSEFSKKCSERWKTMSAKEKGKFEDMAKADKARYEREMKTYIPPQRGDQKEVQGPQCTQDIFTGPLS